MIDINLNELLKGVFLLVLAVAGNFIAETLGCKTQKLLSENMFAKHFISIFILYFAIGFVNNDKPQHPFIIMILSSIIYSLFLLFTKMDLTFTLIVFLLLGTAYINSTFIHYYKLETTDKIELIEKLEKIQKILYILIIILILIGFSLYFRKQYNDYYKTWSTSKFLFGVNKCKSMQ